MSCGRKIVLAASTSESSEHMHSAWKQMLLATLPSRYASVFKVDWAGKGEVWPDGQAKYVPQGLRVVEALLARRFPEEDIAVCYANQLDRFVGEDTRVVGIHAHNPLGITLQLTRTPISMARTWNRSTRRNFAGSSFIRCFVNTSLT